MGDTCQSCRQAPVDISKVLDDPEEPYEVCQSCYHRLMSYSLRPREWYNLRSVHGCLNDLLSEEYYNEKDGTALKPKEEVIDAELFPCPNLEEVSGSPRQLLTYILTRSHIHEEGPVSKCYIHENLLSAMQRHSPDALITVFSDRLSAVRNAEITSTIFLLIGLTLRNKGAGLVRNNWESVASTYAFSGIAFAASICLPREEAHKKVTDILSRMDIRKRSVAKHVLHWFELSSNLDWIEENACSPVDITWGPLAASSKFDWERAKKWLALGRPLSLIALDALIWCVCTDRKPPLLNPPSSKEFISVLEDYLNKDNVPRVREKVNTLLGFSQKLKSPTSR